MHACGCEMLVVSRGGAEDTQRHCMVLQAQCNLRTGSVRCQSAMQGDSTLRVLAPCME